MTSDTAGDISIIFHRGKLFFAICDYFGISEIDFFNSNNASPKLLQKTVDDLERLDTDGLLLIQRITERLLRKSE